jgi:hypothetical protein
MCRPFLESRRQCNLAYFSCWSLSLGDGGSATPVLLESPAGRKTGRPGNIRFIALRDSRLGRVAPEGTIFTGAALHLFSLNRRLNRSQTPVSPVSVKMGLQSRFGPVETASE